MDDLLQGLERERLFCVLNLFYSCLTHTKWKGMDIPTLLQSPFSIFPMHISNVVFATSAAVDNLIPHYVLCNELKEQEYGNVFSLISFPPLCMFGR